MSSRGLIAVLALGGIYYAGSRMGYVPPISELIGLGRDDGNWTPPEMESYTGIQPTPSAVPAVPTGTPVVEMNKYEYTLRQNMANVSGWARQNMHVAAAIMAVENSAINPNLDGDKGTSLGIYQVKIATAETCARAGYSKLAPTAENLHTISGGVYFGTAEMERLSRIKSDRDWIICAYNGGAGWQDMGEKYKRDRLKYLDRVKAKIVQFYGQGEAV